MSISGHRKRSSRIRWIAFKPLNPDGSLLSLKGSRMGSLFRLAALGAILGTATVGEAQTAADVAHLIRQSTVQAALAAARSGEAATIADQVRLCEIPAPPFREAARAKALAEAFRAVGLQEVRIDKAGNVLGHRGGRAARPHVVISAHLDTVFPEGTTVRVSRKGAVLTGPGIGDNCRGLAVLLGIVRALDSAGVGTDGSLTFVGTVGEEGLGDLRGVKALFADTLAGRVDGFISIDGNAHAIANVAVGSSRYRVTFTGPGGHSYLDFGSANPVHALGRAIALLADIPVPATPRATFGVGRVGGGTSVNAIAAEAWMEVDLRSSDAAALDTLDRQFQQKTRQALADENARWNQKGRLSMRVQKVGERPAGAMALDTPMMQAAVAITRALALPVALVEGSTDANVPMHLGIPAIAVGSGGRIVGAHTPGESFDTTDSWRGTQRMVLLAIALARRSG
jgi:acetylornithine deacetylase/succinyl-diaminopimelate desuccinylase-like protein